MDGDLGWMQDIDLINKPIFSGQPGLNPNLEIMEENSDIDFSI
jgi:hypothetical protein